LGTTGSLSYLFDRKGVFTIVPPAGDLEEFELELMDHGLEDLFESEDGLLVYCNFADFGSMQKILEQKKIEIKSAGPQRIPTTQMKITEEQEADVLKLIEALEEDEDVQHVYSTMA
jgi:transcriptional/translational regulatory protein YebC/TACO1